MTTPDHAAALALLDKITPGPYRTHGYNVIRIENDGDPKVITEACSAKKRGGVRGVTPINGDHYLPTHDEALANTHAFAALPELAALYRRHVELAQERETLEIARRNDCDADFLRDLEANVADAQEKLDAALAAVADKLNNQPKTQGE